MFEKKKITNQITIEFCKECKKEIKRKFKEGDALFTQSTNCPSCNGIMLVEKIFTETIEQ